MAPSHSGFSARARRCVGVVFVAIVAIAPLNGAAAVVPSKGQISSGADKSSTELASEKNDVEKEISATHDELAKAGKKVKAAVARFEKADARWRAARASRAEALAQARIAREDAQAAQARATQARELLAISQAQQRQAAREVEAIHQQMDDMARAVYTRGPLAEIEVVLSSASPGDFAARLAAVDAVAQMQSDVQMDLVQAEADLVMQGVRLETLKQEADQQETAAAEALALARWALRKAKTQQARVEALREERRRALAGARTYKATVSDRYDELVAEQKRLEKAARKAAEEEERRRQEALSGGSSNSSGGTFTPTGTLTMPVQGTPSSEPGTRIHPIFKKASCHTGWDIAAPQGTPIVAADSGSVATISKGGAYGNAVMIAHGSGMVTFYAHMSSISVAVGQVLNKGDVIGSVGSTGWSTGPHLHFEVRINGEPYDPRGWFGGERARIAC